MRLFRIFKNQKRNALKLSKGFTLIELLVVIGILAILLAITLIAINPARQFSKANDTKRRNDVNAILNAVNQYMADNKGTVPTAITATAQDISKAGADICNLLVSQYIAALPTDPKTGVGAGGVAGANVTDCTQATYNTKYTISQGSNNRITVGATAEITGDIISVSR